MISPPAGITYEKYYKAITDGNPTHVKIEFENGGGIITDDDIAIDGGITLTSIVNPEIDLTYGHVVSSELVVVLLDNANVQTINWEEAFSLSFGVEINNDTKWVCVGWFYGKKPETSEFSSSTQKITFTAYDIIKDLDIIADDYIAQVQFPATVRDILDAFSSVGGGISYVDITVIDSPVMDLVINENPFKSGTTVRQIIGYVAECCGKFVRAYNGSKDTLAFVTHLAYTMQSVPQDAVYDINISKTETDFVNTIEIIDTSDENNNYIYTDGTGTDTYVIYDNPVLLSAKNNNNIDNALNVLLMRIGFSNNPQRKYNNTPVNATCIGNWLNETGDYIAVFYDRNGSSASTFVRVYTRILKWNGSCIDYYESTGNTKRERLTQTAASDYQLNGKIKQKKELQTPVSDPSAVGTSLEFIATIEQDEQGVITPTKANVSIANDLTTSTDGFVLDARQGKVLNDAIAGKLSVVQLASVSSNSNRTYNVANNSKLLVICFGASTAKEAWIVNVTNTGGVSTMALGTSSVLSTSTASGKLTISNSGGNGAQTWALVLTGSITDET